MREAGDPEAAVSAAEILRFRGYCRSCGKRTLRRGYCSRRCRRLGTLLRRAVRNAGCRTLQELVDCTPEGAPVVLDIRRRRGRTASTPTAPSAPRAENAPGAAVLDIRQHQRQDREEST